MKARQVVDSGVPFNALKWGCRPNPNHFSRYMLQQGAKQADPWRVVERYDHLCTVADAQVLGSCTCCAFTQVVEYHIHRAFGVAVQLDYDWLYKAVRQEIYGDEADEGAQLDEPYLIAKKHGMIPKSTVSHRTTTNAALLDELDHGPVVVAYSVHDGWAPRNMAPNGSVDQSLDLHLIPYTNGHALALVATETVKDVPVRVHRNSWGPLGPDDSGLVACSDAHAAKWTLDYPLSIRLDTDDWAKWRGWEEFVLA